MKTNFALKRVFLTLLFSSALLTFAQEINVKGQITDAYGTPLPGASIVVLETNQGTVTDFDGNFTITVASGNTLLFSNVGFSDQQVVITNQDELNIILQEEITSLEEIVLTGYSTQTRKSITGSVAVVEVAELEDLPDQSILNQIQGRVTGVQIGKSGGPGGFPIVRIRGFGNVSTGNNPLFIIDGVQTNSAEAFNLINPSDIESFQVLKDASAAAIYGTRANNGVIIITTKSGQGSPTDDLQFSINLSSAYQTPRKEAFPEFISPQQYADYLWLRQRNANNTPQHPQYGDGSNPVLPNYLTPTGAQTADESTYLLVAGPNNNPIKKANKAGTDWMDAIFAPDFLTNINVSASKNSEKGSFFISSGISSNNGILKHTSYDRYSLRGNSQFRINEYLTFGESLTVAYSERRGNNGNQAEGGPIMTAHRIMPIIPIYDIKGNFAGTAGAGLGNASNPLASLYRSRNNVAKSIKGLGSVFAEISFLEDFKFKTQFGFDYTSVTTFELTPQRLEDQEQQTVNRFRRENGTYSEITFSNTLHHYLDLDKHRLTTLLGVEYNSRNGKRFFAFRNNFAAETPDFLYLDSGDAGQQFNGGSGDVVNLFSYFGKLDYAFNNKVFLSTSVRLDQSSRYTAENRKGLFPSLGLSWSLGEEPFIENLGFIDQLKLRTAWGQTGNSETPIAYPVYSTFGLNATTNNYDIGGSSSSAEVGYASSRDGNLNLVWETAETFDVGLEMGFLNNRLNFEVAYYSKKTKDMLVKVPRPATSGLADDPFENIGDMQNRGFEFLVDYSGSINNSLDISSSLNLSFNKNEVLKLADEEQFIGGYTLRQNRVTRTEKGYPISYFFGYEVDGIYSSQAEVDRLGQSNGAVGSFRYKDINGDGKIDSADRTMIGSPHPDVLLGYSLAFNYRNFGLSIFMDGTLGNDIYDFKKYFTDFHFFPGALKTTVLDAWSTTNPNGILPISSDSVTNQEIPNSYYVEDGSYVRMRNIKVNYTFPKDWLTPLKIEAAQVYFQIDNAFVITKYSGLDPEINVFDNPYDENVNLTLGVDRGAYPNPRSFVLGFSLNL